MKHPRLHGTATKHFLPTLAGTHTNLTTTHTLQTRVCTAGRIQVPVQSNREPWGERRQREWGASPWRWSGWCQARAESTWGTCECSGARPRRWSPRPCWNDWRCAPWGSRQRSAWGTAGCWPERMRAAHATRCGPPACAAGWPQRWRGLWKQEVTVIHVPRFTHGSENGHPPTAECWKWPTECDQACEKREQCAWPRIRQATKGSHKCNYSHEWNTEQKNSQLFVACGTEAQLFMQLVSKSVTNGMWMEWKTVASQPLRGSQIKLFVAKLINKWYTEWKTVTSESHPRCRQNMFLMLGSKKVACELVHKQKPVTSSSHMRVPNTNCWWHWWADTETVTCKLVHKLKPVTCLSPTRVPHKNCWWH